MSSFWTTTRNSRWSKCQAQHTLFRLIAETRVQIVRGMGENVRRDLLSMLVQQIDLDGPQTGRKAIDAGIPVAR